MSKWCIKTQDPDQTEQLGVAIGGLLKGGEVIELVSDLGGGKTTLTKGFAKGIGSTDLVSSPTFTISNVYKGTKLTLHHYDFYRLGEMGLMSEELAETLEDPEVVSVIEWAEEAHDMLPTGRLIRIEVSLVAADENYRDIIIEMADVHDERFKTLGLKPC